MSKENKPMGISQWKNHGKKYGYWKYFKKKSNLGKPMTNLQEEIISEFEESFKPHGRISLDDITQGNDLFSCFKQFLLSAIQKSYKAGREEGVKAKYKVAEDTLNEAVELKTGILDEMNKKRKKLYRI